MMSMHTGEVEALLQGDLHRDDSIRTRLEEARERKSMLVERLRIHLAEHRCF